MPKVSSILIASAEQETLEIVHSLIERGSAENRHSEKISACPPESILNVSNSHYTAESKQPLNTFAPHHTIMAKEFKIGAIHRAVFQKSVRNVKTVKSSK